MEEIIVSIVARLASKPAVGFDENLFDDLGFDSIKMLELVIELEKGLGIEISDEDLEIENFSSIRAITFLVKKYEFIN